jgi:hypothetical protein
MSPEAVNVLTTASDQRCSEHEVCIVGREERGTPMKKVLIGLVATLVAVSVAGCAGIGKGKGKAPPPIVTKG